MTLSFTELELWLFVLCALLSWRLAVRKEALVRTNFELQRAVALVARIADGMSVVKRDADSGYIKEEPLK